MDTFDQPDSLREHLSSERELGKRIGFVPTMGGLHDGHLALVHHALSLTDTVVVSIFVNPLQFGANEDLDAYPRRLAADLALLAEAGAHVVFTPSADVMYPDGLAAQTKVLVPELTNVLCGASRPGHFDGVSTVVCKLFNMVAPDIAVFGQKDLQQLLIIQRMVADLALPIAVVGHPTARDTDGLALSSRNSYLTTEERKIAPQLYAALCTLADAIEQGDRDYSIMEAKACAHLREAGFQPDYIEVRRVSDLGRVESDDRELAIFGAARLGHTRLIDNIRLTISESR